MGLIWRGRSVSPLGRRSHGPERIGKPGDWCLCFPFSSPFLPPGSWDRTRISGPRDGGEAIWKWRRWAWPWTATARWPPAFNTCTRPPKTPRWVELPILAHTTPFHIELLLMRFTGLHFLLRKPYQTAVSLLLGGTRFSTMQRLCNRNVSTEACFVVGGFFFSLSLTVQSPACSMIWWNDGHGKSSGGVETKGNTMRVWKGGGGR